MAFIWALNTIFNFNIVYTWKIWLAFWILIQIFYMCNTNKD